MVGSHPWIGESLEALEEPAQERRKERDAGFASKGETTSLEVPSSESVASVYYYNPFVLIGKYCGVTGCPPAELTGLD